MSGAHWCDDAVVYCLDIETFADADGDGIGDIDGLRARLDYLAELGVTCLWLLPFYPTPNRDDGYDVTDHRAVDSRLGTLDGFDALVRECRERGMRILVDVIANHTSDEHPWFSEARQYPQSDRRPWYVWADEPRPDPSGTVFPGEVDRSWTYEPVAGSWFLHRYYPFQPDLDTGHPAVRAEIEGILGFWIEHGASGFRIDSAPFVIDPTVKGRLPADPHDVFRAWRRFTSSRSDDCVLVGEAYLEPEETRAYFGDGDQFHALYDFTLNNCIWLALARETAEPLERALAEPKPPPGCRWFTFLRLHDELSVEKLSADERDDVLDAFAPGEEMRVYGRGTRRRVASMLGGSTDRLQLAFSLLLSFPGTPVLLYGDELGLREDLGLPGRLSVRVPMRWTDGQNGGFSSADPQRLVRGVGSGATSVQAQEGDPGSMLAWFRRAIAARHGCSGLGPGRAVPMQTGSEAVFAHRVELDDGSLVAVHNLGGTAQGVDLDLPGTGVTEILGDRHAATRTTDDPSVLAPYGYRWLRVE